MKPATISFLSDQALIPSEGLSYLILKLTTLIVPGSPEQARKVAAIIKYKGTLVFIPRFFIKLKVTKQNVISLSLRASRAKIGVFLATVMTTVVIIGTLMYLVEGEANGFTSIPRGIYWAIVTITTVGYGDIAPATTLGQFIASITMLTGYAIIAVPTGIVTAEFANQQKIMSRHEISTQACPECLAEGHNADALWCRKCGSRLN